MKLKHRSTIKSDEREHLYLLVELQLTIISNISFVYNIFFKLLLSIKCVKNGFYSFPEPMVMSAVILVLSDCYVWWIKAVNPHIWKAETRLYLGLMCGKISDMMIRFINLKITIQVNVALLPLMFKGGSFFKFLLDVKHDQSSKTWAGFV